MTKLLVLSGVFASFIAPSAIAQDTAREQIRLKLEISRNGAMVAKPIVRFDMGNTASVAPNDGPTFSVAPYRLDAVWVLVICDFNAGDAAPRLRLRLQGEQQSSAAITIGGDRFDLKVGVLR